MTKTYPKKAPKNLLPKRNRPDFAPHIKSTPRKIIKNGRKRGGEHEIELKQAI